MQEGHARRPNTSQSETHAGMFWTRISITGTPPMTPSNDDGKHSGKV